MRLNLNMKVERSLVVAELKLPLTAVCNPAEESVTELRVPHRIEAKKAYVLTLESGKRVLMTICHEHNEVLEIR